MAKERRFVLVTSSFPIRGDGSEAAGAFVADLAEALAAHLPVRVVAPGSCANRERWANRVEVFRYAAPAFPLSTLKPWKPSHLRWIATVLRGGQSATRAAIDGETSRVLALWALPCGEWVMRAAREHGIGYSVWMLGSDVWSLGRIPILRGKLARVIRSASSAYADGYRLAADAQRIAGVPVEFLPSTRKINLENSGQPRSRGPFRLLFLGRWHPNKGVDLLLDALDVLSDEDWRHIEVVEIHGGGPLGAKVQSGVAALRARGRPVEVGGFLVKSDAEAAIARADWVLIPSRIESIPVVFSDAMKLGRPVVATPVGDLPRLLETHRCGVGARTVDSRSFAQALASALRAGTEQYAAGVQAAAAQFSLPSVVERLLSEPVGAR